MNVIKFSDNDEVLEFDDGSRLWKKNDRPHREDDFAIENKDGSGSYWLYGRRVFFANRKEFLSFVKLKAFWK
jgi:hypothetical protein